MSFEDDELSLRLQILAPVAMRTIPCALLCEETARGRKLSRMHASADGSISSARATRVATRLKMVVWVRSWVRGARRAAAIEVNGHIKINLLRSNVRWTDEMAQRYGLCFEL